MISGRENDRIPFDLMDILDIDEKTLVAQNKTVTFQFFASIFQAAANINALCWGVNEQMTVICFDKSYLIGGKRMNRVFVCHNPAVMLGTALCENIIKFGEKSILIDWFDQKL